MRILNTVDAVREAHALILSEGQENILIGEGVPDPKCCFGTTRDLHKKFPGQVFDSPISENGVTGICIGAALNGIKPIHIHMRQDFLLYAFDQIVNNAAKWSSMFGGQGGHVPLVIKAFTGRGWGSGHQHSQNLESIFCHIPGLKVIVPSSPRTAKGLLIAAAHDKNPCIILEDRWIHHLEGEVPEGSYETQIGRAEIVREGKDAVVIVWGQLVSEAVRAAKILEEQYEFSLEVIDLLTISHPDMFTINRSLKKHSRRMVFSNSWANCGLAKSIAFDIHADCFFSLDNFYPSSSPALTKNYYVNHQTIIEWAMGFETDSLPRLEPHDIPDKSFTGPF